MPATDPTLHVIAQAHEVLISATDLKIAGQLIASALAVAVIWLLVEKWNAKPKSRGPWDKPPTTH